MRKDDPLKPSTLKGRRLEIEEALETWLKITFNRPEQERSKANCASIQTHGDYGEGFLFHQWF